MMSEHHNNHQGDTPLLVLQDVSVTYHTSAGDVPAADRVSFKLDRGGTIGIVGESGSGKSTVGRAVLGMVDPALATVTGMVLYDDKPVLVTSDMPARKRLEMENNNRKLRGSRAALIPQKLKTPANPVQRIGGQLVEQILSHGTETSWSKAQKLAELQLLASGLDGWFDAFPHELSGGMCQLFWIAMALANKPSLIVADESTTALDVVRQREFMKSLMTHQKQGELNLSVLLISHDLALLEEFADRVVVMYAGRVVEAGPMRDVFGSPRHPYTAGLLDTLLRMDGTKKTVFPVIRGELPKLTALPKVGCHFTPRCPYAKDRCTEEAAELVDDDAAKWADRCIRRDKWKQDAQSEKIKPSDPDPVVPSDPKPVVEVKNLFMEFRVKKGLGLWGSDPKPVLKGVTLSIAKSETVALIGRSGCGKSTLARIVAGLIKPTSGRVEVNGRVAMVFQDPGASLNPLVRVGDAVSGPIRWRGYGKRDAHAQATKLLAEVGLPDAADRFPNSLSGGQQQRVAIARALAVEPALLILDEAVTALDCSIRGQILNLLREINRTRQVALFFITHDLCVARHFANRIVVMCEGKLEEGEEGNEYRELLKALPRYQNAST